MLSAPPGQATVARRARVSELDLLLGAFVLVGIVLRCWALGSTRLSFDETFTAMAARLPVTTLFTYLRHADTHPPLDYLIRVPLARAGVSDGWFRFPSVVESVLALDHRRVVVASSRSTRRHRDRPARHQPLRADLCP